jgi:hypothetical protein
LRDRDQASHNALAAEMLYRGVVGTEPASHPEIQAFKQGFELPCRNGFSFFDVSYNIFYLKLKSDIVQNNRS